MVSSVGGGGGDACRTARAYEGAPNPKPSKAESWTASKPETLHYPKPFTPIDYPRKPYRGSIGKLWIMLWEGLGFRVQVSSILELFPRPFLGLRNGGFEGHLEAYG